MDGRSEGKRRAFRFRGRRGVRRAGRGGGSFRIGRRPHRSVQLLKVAHHGSGRSSSSEFLKYTDPAWAVISCGANNRYGHPGEDTMERLKACGIQPFLTMDSGAVTVTTDGERMTVQTFLEGK